MTTEELFEYLLAFVPTFANLEIVENGIAYHYTSNLARIQELGRFMGAPVDENLDRTQSSLNSPPATSDPGVVFAYLRPDQARDEGFGCDIVKITFNKAIIGNHTQENSLGDRFNSLMHEANITDTYFVEEPMKTVLILNTEILNFESVP